MKDNSIPLRPLGELIEKYMVHQEKQDFFHLSAQIFFQGKTAKESTLHQIFGII
jgi:hypothetical protein